MEKIPLETYNFHDIPKNKIIIIPCDDKTNRKIIHQYIENNYPEIKKMSLQSKLFYREQRKTFIECYYCDYKRVHLNKYHSGQMKNNEDEYMTGTCPKCHEFISWDINFDGWDEITRLYYNNIIVCGDYITCNVPNHAKKEIISKNVYISSTKGINVYQIDQPEKINNKILNKRKLQCYIDSKLQEFM
ncbi:hypothetical protein Catovirus_1_29 [Catovirus CTV1]|uniref:Uncharacterized protein n=1 Tax=Catovirus CTV1 TaxID=1977631 RepID=A0A1V0S8F2_9VIRU|nr:hypothetical protein Catovirus_1_29 [Catovirus CTV1]